MTIVTRQPGPTLVHGLNEGREILARGSKTLTRLHDCRTFERGYDVQRVAQKPLEFADFNDQLFLLIRRSAEHAVATRAADHVKGTTTNVGTKRGERGTIDSLDSNGHPAHGANSVRDLLRHAVRQRTSSSGEDAHVTTKIRIGGSDLNVVTVGRRGENLLTHDADAKKLIGPREKFNDLIGVEPRVLVQQEALVNSWRDALKERLVTYASDVLWPNAETLGNEFELIDEAPITGVVPDEQGAGLKEIERGSGLVEDVTRDVAPRCEGPTVQLEVVFFAGRYLGAGRDHSRRGPRRARARRGVEESDPPTRSGETKRAGRPDHSATDDEYLTLSRTHATSVGASGTLLFRYSGGGSALPLDNRHDQEPLRPLFRT